MEKSNIIIRIISIRYTLDNNIIFNLWIYLYKHPVTLLMPKKSLAKRRLYADHTA